MNFIFNRYAQLSIALLSATLLFSPPGYSMQEEETESSSSLLLRPAESKEYEEAKNLAEKCKEGDNLSDADFKILL